MKYLLILLALVAAPAWAEDHSEQIDFMVKECKTYMERGVCRVQNAKPLPDSMRSRKWHLGFGLGVVSTGAYMDVQAQGDNMCEFIKQVCTAEWDGEHCRVVRANWKQK